MAYRITKSTVDAIARTCAAFYKENPNINLDSQKNVDFCEVIDLCLSQVNEALPCKIDSQIGSANWWKHLYKIINADPPVELKEYFYYVETWDTVVTT